MTSLIEDLDSPGTPVESPSGSGRSYGPVVSVLAALLCAGGLGWAVWTVYESTKPVGRPHSASDLVRQEVRADAKSRDTAEHGPEAGAGHGSLASATGSRAGHRVAIGGDGPEMPVLPKDVSYTPIASAEQASEVVQTLGGSIGAESAKIDGLTPTPLQTSDQIATAVRNFLGPLVQGEVTDAPAFLTSNGAKAPEKGAFKPVLENIAALLKFCDLDTTHTSVRRAPKIQSPLGNKMPKLPAGAIPMMINRQERDDGQSVSSLMMPLAGLLPEADVGIAENAPRIEVLIPAKLKDPQFAGKPFQIGLILAQNAGKGRWIPEMLQFHTSDVETVKALSKAIMPRSRSSESGAPAPKAPSDRN